MQGVASLVEALPIYGKLRTLDVSMNFLQADGGIAIANVLAGNPGLITLRMNSCYIRSEGGCAIGEERVLTFLGACL
jgi:Ran GTPase-activating protein (RanGAP) involved in mRNA processing and transport